MQIKINKTKLLICLGVSLAITIAVLIIKGVFSSITIKETAMILSDSFFLGGSLMLVAAGLVWASDHGVSDGIGYSFSKLFSLRKRDYEEHKESYSEYKDRKHARKSSVIEFLIAGLGFVVISVVFLLIYLGV